MLRPMRTLAVLAALVVLSGSSARAAEPPARRILIINSFGSRFAPFAEFASVLRNEIARQSPGPVEFLETPLELARFEDVGGEGPFARYVGTLVTGRQPDLVITIGGPAAHFAASHRDELSAAVPLLITGLDARHRPELAEQPNQVVVDFNLRPAAVVADILRLLPDTTTLAIVLGNSPLEKFWHAQLERELRPMNGRLQLVVAGHAAARADAAARIDPARALGDPVRRAVRGRRGHPAGRGPGAGEPERRRPEPRCSAGSKASSATASSAARCSRSPPRAGAALRWPCASSVARAWSASPCRPAQPERYTYDWRELNRWNIPERRLPPGSDVRFRPPSLWEAYRRPLVAGLLLVGLEALLIGALLAQRARRHRAEEQVRALNRRLLTAQEDERKLLARELHDDFSQRLARLSIDAARLEYAAAVPLDGARQAPMREELARLSEDVHALAYQLHPSTLDDLGLIEALKIEADHFSRLESIPVRLDLGEPPPEPSREAALCLFRVAQEGLRNVKRHARARAVDLACAADGRGTKMILRDDGAGFDPAQTRRPSLGLAGMRERAALVGGRIEIQSAPGRGTTIVAWVPDGGGAA